MESRLGASNINAKQLIASQTQYEKKNKSEICVLIS